MEEEVVQLEHEVLHFRQDLYQEAVYISSTKRSVDNSTDSYAQCPIQNHKSERHNCSALNVVDYSVCTRRHRPSLSGKLSAQLDLKAFEGMHLVWKKALRLCPLLSFPEDGRGKEYKLCKNSTKNQKGSPIHKSQTIKTPVKRPLMSQRSAEKRLDPQNLQVPPTDITKFSFSFFSPFDERGVCILVPIQ